MKINRKIEIAEQAIRSISHHDDEDLAMREAALARLSKTIDAERVAANKRLQERIEEQMYGKAEGTARA